MLVDPLDLVLLALRLIVDVIVAVVITRSVAAPATAASPSASSAGVVAPPLVIFRAIVGGRITASSVWVSSSWSLTLATPLSEVELGLRLLRPRESVELGNGSKRGSQ